MFDALAPQAYQRDLAMLSQPQEPLTALPEAARQFAAEFAATLNRNEATSRAALTGGADPHALVEALTSTQNAVETVVAVRDRVVEAYQEILRMPV